MERSLVLVKPDAVERGFSGAIIGRLESAGITLVALKCCAWTPLWPSGTTHRTRKSLSSKV